MAAAGLTLAVQHQYLVASGSRTASLALSVMHAVSKNLICGSIP